MVIIFYVLEHRGDAAKDFFSQFGPFDYILASDVIYEMATFDLLIDTLCHVSNPATPILIAYKQRYEREKIFFHKAKKYFEITEVCTTQCSYLEGSKRKNAFGISKGHYVCTTSVCKKGMKVQMKRKRTQLEMIASCTKISSGTEIFVNYPLLSILQKNKKLHSI